MSAHVLHNPTAPRQVRKAARGVISSLRARGHRVTVLAESTPAATSAALKRAVDDGDIEHLIIAGGDGLVHLAIQHVAQTSIPVTICPVGTGNDFARAIQEHDTGAGVSADLIRITSPDQTTAGTTQIWAASVAIAGFPAEINARANTMSRHWGANVYSIAAILQLPHFKQSTIALSVDDMIVSTNTAMIAIGNTKFFGGGMLPCPDALPDDHLLHLTSIEGVSRRGLIPHLLGRTGGTADRPEVRRERGTQIRVDTSGEAFWADGEPVGESPLTFEIVPNALRIERATGVGD